MVHLMPVQEYVHFPTDDWQASFKDDAYMIQQGVSEENYQWGYRTTFAMAVESRYRTKGGEPGTERDQFRDLVQAFHDKGVAVIIDIVPNHTGENMDGGQWFFNFAGIDKQYYYRTKDFEHIGAYGNEVKTEERPMTQRWIIDQFRKRLKRPQRQSENRAGHGRQLTVGHETKTAGACAHVFCVSGRYW